MLLAFIEIKLEVRCLCALLIFDQKFETCILGRETDALLSELSVNYHKARKVILHRHESIGPNFNQSKELYFGDFATLANLLFHQHKFNFVHFVPSDLQHVQNRVNECVHAECFEEKNVLMLAKVSEYLDKLLQSYTVVTGRESHNFLAKF